MEKIQTTMVRTVEKTCGRTSIWKKEKETKWWNERIGEAVKRKKTKHGENV